MKIVNKGALPTKIYVKAPDGTTIPFLSQDDIKQKERRRKEDLIRARQMAISQATIKENEGGEEGGEEESKAADPPNASVAEAMAVQASAQEKNLNLQNIS